ncbi:hypothetical protein CNMCM5793_001664 [Aspergillus hiratsukae]|uniref:Uncharacterized protein n=1 Tax=Aspergillus hiratsukae TaxID=1194566 RepID=A0A8H6P153_9EURO|nr:hypothetical protein CNMCM5793_001664 [Aspergillus hiratsukae]KAF7156569.1 hypothetical protein CNMCM6106_000601 [Aspergillus hiratsukae]
MLPPSDSSLHHSHKLREVIANTRNRVVCTPPPPYSSTVPRNSTHDERQNVLDIDDDETTCETCPYGNSTPITINIDASISVVGNGNTIMIPSMAGHPQQTPSASTSTNSENSSSSSTAASETDALHSVQKQRQARLTEMATSIINALYDSGRLAPPTEDQEPAPLEIKINTGIKVEGSRNVICVGATVRAQSNKSAQTQMGTDKDRQVISNRKRRALSEPLEVPKFKKNCAQ